MKEGEKLGKFFRTIILLFIIYLSWPFIENQIEKTEYAPILENIKTDIQALGENPRVTETVDVIYETINELTNKLEDSVGLLPQKDSKLEQAKKPDLAIPSQHTFSVHNIVLGELKENVEKQTGAPKRSSLSEYGTKWYTYHENYHNFLMVAYDSNNRVAGLYTNQDLISSQKGIKLGTMKENVQQQLGEPLKQIRKGLIYYQFEENRDYDVFKMDKSFVTIFYDKHAKNTVTAIQIIDENLEQAKNHFYTSASMPLKEGFEYQLFDLTNADRVNHNLTVLKWDDQVRETARKHSQDMADQNYFSHTNLEGLSPFDRMSKDHISFTMAGENLATGQFSSIFAHEGLMNSLGHRENILRPEYRNLGVGVAFNSKSQPYYTENFYRK